MKLLARGLLLVICGVGFDAYSQSPYIYKVYEYMPAPGQFVNKLPLYEQGDTKNDMRLKAEESIEGETGVIVSLGGYGGYITFGFDHMVENVKGEYDFKILGNAFYANTNPNADAHSGGGSCEPGIVMVSYDANGNGKPDDEWYELAGSEYRSSQTIHNYKITYYKPDENKIKTPDNSYPFLNDTTYIRWESNQGKNGYMARNIFHNQSYYPLWIDDEEITFEGTKLADNYIDESGEGSYYVLYSYAWGYADNHPNFDERSNFKIEWAVDKNGDSVELPGVHFIKVYTGVNQYCGGLGETSTEIVGAQDLHLLKKEPNNIIEEKNRSVISVLRSSVTDKLILTSSEERDIYVYSSCGLLMINTNVMAGTSEIECGFMNKGIYILISGDEIIRFIKQ